MEQENLHHNAPHHRDLPSPAWNILVVCPDRDPRRPRAQGINSCTRFSPRIFSPRPLIADKLFSFGLLRPGVDTSRQAHNGNDEQTGNEHCGRARLQTPRREVIMLIVAYPCAPPALDACKTRPTRYPINDTRTTALNEITGTLRGPITSDVSGARAPRHRQLAFLLTS